MISMKEAERGRPNNQIITINTCNINVLYLWYFCHSCAGRNPVDAAFWIPAFAGMTKPRIFFMQLSIILNHRNSKRYTDYMLSYFGHWSLIHWLLFGYWNLTYCDILGDTVKN